jgi:hypothetical protein
MRISSATSRCVLCTAILWLGTAIGARASIVVPDSQLFAIDLKLGTSASAEGTSSAERSSPTPSAENQNRNAIDRTSAQDAFSFGGSSTGTSTTSSGSSGGGSNTFALRTVNAELITDPAIAGWHSGERRFALPMPPGTDLLRPPQC